MDSSALAVAAGAAVAGLGSLLVPHVIARVPEVEPTHADPTEAGSEGDGTVDVAAVPEAPPEPFADIAARPGLAWRSAVAGLLVGGLLGGALGWTWGWVMWVPMVPVYLALAIIDWRTRLLPTHLIRPSYAVVGVLALLGGLVTRDGHDVVMAALGWLVGGGSFAVLWFIYPRGLGYGDVRLAGVLGIGLGWLGWGPLLVGLYAGFLLGGVIGAVLVLLRLADRKGVPFGPFMLLGSLVGIAWGEPIWSRLVGG
jgi:leader peptidase (prepilin peptidase) / N-methyltransferase